MMASKEKPGLAWLGRRPKCLASACTSGAVTKMAVPDGSRSQTDGLLLRALPLICINGRSVPWRRWSHLPRSSCGA